MQPPRGPVDQSGTPPTLTTTRATGLVAVLVALSLTVAGVAQPVLAADDPEISLEYDGDQLVLDSAPNQTIRGTTSLPPGTSLYVRLQSANSDQPFIKTRAATVGPDGSFNATFDLSNIEPAQIRVSVGAENSSASAEFDARVGSPQTTTEAGTLDLPTDVSVGQGGTADIPLSVPTGESAVLTIGDTQAGYGLAIRVQDANEDGEVTVTFHSGAAGTTDPTVGVTSADRFEVVQPEPDLDGALPSGQYDLALAADSDSDPVAIGRLVVENGAVSTTAHPDPGAATNVVPPLSDPFWRTTAPGIAGVLALLSGLASILISRR